MFPGSTGRAAGLVLSGALAACVPPSANGGAGPPVASAVPPRAEAATKADDDPPPTLGDALAGARRCGLTLGVAARCNLLRDDRDYAVVRFAMLEQLEHRFAKVADRDRVTEAFDLAALDRLASVGRCDVPGAQATVVRDRVRDAVRDCTEDEDEGDKEKAAAR